jgi:hypothetical protein
VVDGCLAILSGSSYDEGFLFVLAGPGARNVIDGREGGLGGYWPRTWALRGLLHVWDERATAAVVRALSDEHWRPREMALKVVAAHRVDTALEAAAALRDDETARVRAAASRALSELSALN